MLLLYCNFRGHLHVAQLGNVTSSGLTDRIYVFGDVPGVPEHPQIYHPSSQLPCSNLYKYLCSFCGRVQSGWCSQEARGGPWVYCMQEEVHAKQWNSQSHGKCARGTRVCLWEMQQSFQSKWLPSCASEAVPFVRALIKDPVEEGNWTSISHWVQKSIVIKVSLTLNFDEVVKSLKENPLCFPFILSSAVRWLWNHLSLCKMYLRMPKD